MREVFVLHGEYGAGRPFGCTFIRHLRPLSHPTVAGAIGLAHGTGLPADRAPSLVLVERLPHAPVDRLVAQAERLVRDLAVRGIPYVYATDDNLLDLNRDRPWERVPGEEARAAIRLLARRAAGVIVSTEALRERMGGLNSKVVTVPNFLDERLFGSAAGVRRENDPLVVGYMGTGTHDGELRMILRPLRDLLSRARGRVRLEVVGVTTPENVAAYFEGLPVTRLEPGAKEAYPSFPGWMRQSLHWDFGLAPLSDDPFERCKSDLKYLDYAALGIPGVFSDVRPYRETVRHRETGLVVPNEPDAWAAALGEMAGDGALRARLAEAATAEVYANRMLRTNATRWRDAFETIVPGFFT